MTKDKDSLPGKLLDNESSIQGARRDFVRPLTNASSMSLMGHVWTVPAVQEESDYQRSVRVRSCIRPVVAWRITSVAMQPFWPLALM
jgi:hypothetical protein